MLGLQQISDNDWSVVGSSGFGIGGGLGHTVSAGAQAYYVLCLGSGTAYGSIGFGGMMEISETEEQVTIFDF